MWSLKRIPQSRPLEPGESHPFAPDPDAVVPLVKVPEIIEAEYGRRVTRQTVWAWARHGLTIPGGRARLQVVERGRRLYTTRRWLDWFMHEG